MNLGNVKTAHKILAVIALLGFVAVATGIGEVTRSISGVSQAAGETGAAASQVLSAANDLSKQAETLRAEFHDFVAVVRAA